MSESLALDLWLREIGPSDELRRWFGHRPERWDEFQTVAQIEAAIRLAAAGPPHAASAI